MIPILGIIFGLPMVIGLVAVLTEHQRKMAQIVRLSAVDTQSLARVEAELAQMRAEMAQMRDLMHQQVLANDRVLSAATPDIAESLRQRG